MYKPELDEAKNELLSEVTAMHEGKDTSRHVLCLLPIANISLSPNLIPEINSLKSKLATTREAEERVIIEQCKSISPVIPLHSKLILCDLQCNPRSGI